MHTLRHTAAMRLLHAGIDITVIALWLGHEQITTAQIYLHADMGQKERAIARVTPPGTAPGRYRPPDPLMAFLNGCDCPDLLTADALPASPIHAQVGTIVRSEQSAICLGRALTAPP